MKNLTKICILFASCLLFTYQSNAQVLYSEDFSAGMPSDIILIDNDNKTINPSLVPPFPSTAAWVVLPQTTWASSASWFDPEGCCADDWMILPAVTIGESTALKWDAMTPDGDFRDGYVVRISTSGTDMTDFTANPPLFSTTGENPIWTERTVYLFDEGYQNQTIHIAFINNSNDKFILRLDNIQIYTVPDYDASVENFVAPVTLCEKTSSETVVIKVKNNGIEDIFDFEVYYSVNGGTPVTEIVGDTLAFGETLVYTFSQSVDLSTVGNYDFTIGVNLTNDANPDNDEISGINVNSLAPFDLEANEYSTSFESAQDVLGWSILDENQDGSGWRLSDFDPNTGDFSMAYFWNSNNNADDWLISRCLEMDDNKYYVLEFFYSTASSQYPEKLKVHLGSDATATAMTTLIEDFGEMYNDYYEFSRNIFSPATSGTHYIGFHAYSDADQWAILVDDVSIRELLKPVSDFTYNANELTVNFTDISANLPNQWDWDFGETGVPSASTDKNPTFTYSTPGTYNVCMVASNEAGTGNPICKEVTVQLVNVNEIHTRRTISIFPNPAQNTLNIAMELETMENVEIMMFNQVGQNVQHIHSGNWENGTLQTDISNLAQGVYFIQLKSETLNEVRKLIITE